MDVNANISVNVNANISVNVNAMDHANVDTNATPIDAKSNVTRTVSELKHGYIGGREDT